MVDVKVRRSHQGCVRCKRRRQKCDEKKPSCGRCAAAEEPCSYAITLKWDGRTARRIPDKPVSKECLEKSWEINSIQETSFLSSSVLSSDLQKIVRSEISPGSLYLAQEIEPLSWLPTESRSLLFHFINQASHITSCHVKIQERICRLILPLALQTPSLMDATLALSALHRSALTTDTPKYDLDELVSSLVASSLQELRFELQQEDLPAKYALLATIRTLCVCEIHSGKADPGSWRVHVDGARALLETTRNLFMDEHPSQQSESQWLVESWYASIESLTALTTHRGLPKGQLAEFGPRALIHDATPGGQYLDIYTGYTTDLNAVFQEIGAAAWERRHLHEIFGEESTLTAIDLDNEADWLEASIRSMITQPTFHPDVMELLTETERQEFEACNESYEYTALINIQRRVRELPLTHPQVQESVKSIIRCAQRMTPTNGLSPWVMMTTPLFAAGCEALGEDREIIRDLMQSLYESLRIRNCKRSLDLLELRWNSDHWKLGDDLENLLSKNDWDFIPY